ncbi:hypothetical protein KKE06_04470 [Candidatus Micrarchaeota archaeon]|nr:hypothetical protein [Candidatus Micrarchaeota archaeon]
MDKEELEELSIKKLNYRVKLLTSMMEAATNREDIMELNDQIIDTMNAWSKRICRGLV